LARKSSKIAKELAKICFKNLPKLAKKLFKLYPKPYQNDQTLPKNNQN
jgi:hypothetical protein